MTDLDRRSFLKAGAAVAGGAAIAGPFQGFAAAGAWAAPTDPDAHQLVPVADLRDQVVRLALPPGFQYRSFQPSSRSAPLILNDGARMPGRHDGMAAFEDGVNVTLIRNHEENGAGANNAPAGTGTPIYDTGARGGTSTVDVTHDGQVLHAVMSIAGTQMNCSGGEMPWGAWITCEETVNGPDVADDFTRTPVGGTDPGPNTYVTNRNLTKPHGAIFEVPVDGTATAVPIKNAGRFPHESVAWDPHSKALYLSEDNFAFPSGFYKYVPPADPVAVGSLRDGGRLYMLKVAGADNVDLSRKHPDKATYDVEWVEIDDPWFEAAPPASGQNPEWTNDEALRVVSLQGLAKGAAKFSRLEGTVYDGGLVYFTSTQGGGAPMTTDADTVNGFGRGWGQVWAYDSRSEQLHLMFESPNRNVLDFPDNVTTSPRGTLVLCEDHDDFNFLRGLTPRGKLITFAQNIWEGRTGDEFAGSTFSGSTLFVNIQASSGISFAIWGDWASIGV